MASERHTVDIQRASWDKRHTHICQHVSTSTNSQLPRIHHNSASHVVTGSIWNLARRYRELLKRAVADGHELGNHLQFDPWTPTDVDRCCSFVGPCCWEPWLTRNDGPTTGILGIRWPLQKVPIGISRMIDGDCLLESVINLSTSEWVRVIVGKRYQPLSTIFNHYWLVIVVHYQPFSTSIGWLLLQSTLTSCQY